MRHVTHTSLYVTLSLLAHATVSLFVESTLPLLYPRRPRLVGSDDNYSVGIIGKRRFAANVEWNAGLCAEMKRVGLWQSVWWTN